MILSIYAEHPEPRKIRKACDALERGEVIAYPTDTVYALGCDLRNKKAIERLYEIKGLDASKPLAMICFDLSNIAEYALVENHQYRILKHYLPGPYCFILEATKEVPKMLQSKRRTIGIRIPQHEVTRELVREFGRPILTTTAQGRDDEFPHVDPFEIDEAFPGLGLVIDSGAGGLVPTTVVDLTESPPKLVREGAGPSAPFLS